MLKESTFLEDCVRDIKALLTEDDEELVEYGPEAFEDPDIVMLWDHNGRTVTAGVAYGTSELLTDIDDDFVCWPEDEPRPSSSSQHARSACVGT